MRSARERNLSWQRFLNSNNYILDPQDTISRLPDGAIHHIISFLPLEDKDQLRLLSRKWRLIYSQTQKELHLSSCRIDEQLLLTVFQDYFPSVEMFALVNCNGIKNLKIVNYKLRNVALSKCANLEKVELITPNLEGFGFTCFVNKPCIVELGPTTPLKHLQLVGAYINETTFSDCNTTFPVLCSLTIGGSHLMSDSLNISSSSLKAIYFFEFKKPVEITIDAPKLVYVQYRGHTIANFSNVNLPRVKRAKIELNPDGKLEPDSLWFQKLVGMLQAFKPVDMLLLKVNSYKFVVIPEELRRILALLVRGPKMIMVDIYNPPTNVVDLIDTILWISPRVRYLCVVREDVMRYVQLRHGEEILGTQGHSCCTSYPTRCWRHSLVEYNLDKLDENWGKDLASYFRANLVKVGRNAIQRSFLD